jgi:Flp pilus assembly protein TadG
MRSSIALRSIRSMARDRSGATAVEFALLAPVLFMFLMGILEMGLALWMQNSLDYSVAEAARCAANSSTCGAPSSQTSALVTAYAAGVSGAALDSSVFTYSHAASPNNACGYQVTASYPLTLAIPFLNYSLTLTSSACYPN